MLYITISLVNTLTQLDAHWLRISSYERRTNFLITEREIIGMMIEIEDEKKIDLTLQDVLHIPELWSNLISILKICNICLNMYFGIDDIVARFNDGYIAIQEIH